MQSMSARLRSHTAGRVRQLDDNNNNNNSNIINIIYYYYYFDGVPRRERHSSGRRAEDFVTGEGGLSRVGG